MEGPAQNYLSGVQSLPWPGQGISDIHIPSPWKGRRKHFCWCARCVFLNPLDVTAPIWRWDWLDRNLSACPIHGDAFRALSSGRVLARGNFDQLLLLVSRQEQKLHNEILWQLRWRRSLRG